MTSLTSLSTNFLLQHSPNIFLMIIRYILHCKQNIHNRIVWQNNSNSLVWFRSYRMIILSLSFSFSQFTFLNSFIMLLTIMTPKWNSTNFLFPFQFPKEICLLSIRKNSLTNYKLIASFLMYHFYITRWKTFYYFWSLMMASIRCLVYYLLISISLIRNLTNRNVFSLSRIKIFLVLIIL